MKIRVRFAKEGNMRFIGHLDIMRYFQKAFQRAGLPVKFTEGFHPHPVLSFASPLSVGLTSEGEYFDTELLEDLAGEEITSRLNSCMAEGMQILSVSLLPDVEKKRNNNAMALVGMADYRVRLKEALPGDRSHKEALADFLAAEEIMIIKRSKRNAEETNIRPFIYSMKWEDETETYFLHLSAGSAHNLKPETVMDSYLRFLGEDIPREEAVDAISRAGRYDIHRLDMMTAEGLSLGDLGEAI